MEEGQPAAAVRDVGSSEHGDPPLDEKFKCLCERCRVAALQNGALFNCRWNRDALLDAALRDALEAVVR